MIPEDVILEVKKRANIGDVVGRYVKLKRRGKNLVGLCPFHNEKTPSFNVHPDDGFFKCFGCGASGDVVSFLERHTGQAFPDIVRGLAAEVGIEVPDRKMSPEEVRRKEVAQKLQRVLDLAQIYFRQRLAHVEEGRAARAYLKDSRKVPDEQVEQFGLGFGGARDNGLLEYLERHDVPVPLALEAGVLADGRRGPYDFFRNRVTFPIRDRRGRVVSFSARIFGRADEKRPKYVNGPASAVYDKSSVLYGLFESLPALKQGKPAVLVEGQLDVLAVHRAGLPTAVAPCGTSLTDRHVSELARSTERVVLCLDADAAGQKAAERSLLMFLKAGFDVALCELTESDPDDMVRSGQGDALRQRLEGAPPALDVLIERAIERAAGSMNARIRALEGLLPFLAAMPKDSLPRRQYVKRVARAFDEDEAWLTEQLAKEGERGLRRKIQAPAPPRGDAAAPRDAGPVMPEDPMGAEDSFRDVGPAPARPRPAPRAKLRWTDAELGLAKALLCHPQLAPRCGVLVEGMRNAELRTFVGKLTEALVRFHDEEPREVLKKVPAPSAVARLFAEIYFQRGLERPDTYLTEGAAAELIEAFIHTLEQRHLKVKLSELRRAIEAATERGDHETARQLLPVQRAVVSALTSHEAPPMALPAPTAPPPLRLVAPAGFEEGEDVRDPAPGSGGGAASEDADGELPPIEAYEVLGPTPEPPEPPPVGDAALPDEPRVPRRAPDRPRGRPSVDRAQPLPWEEEPGEHDPAALEDTLELPEDDDFAW